VARAADCGGVNAMEKRLTTFHGYTTCATSDAEAGTFVARTVPSDFKPLPKRPSKPCAAIETRTPVLTKHPIGRPNMRAEDPLDHPRFV
jgi:hypothetical protein